MKDKNIWNEAIVEQKERGKPWTAQALADFLDGEWINPPTDPNWTATCFFRSGWEASDGWEAPVSIIMSQDPKERPSNNSRAIIGPPINQNFAASKPYLMTQENLTDAFLRMAVLGRESMKGKIISIAGSVGKTTVTHMLADLLKLYGTVRHTIRSKNLWFDIRTLLAACIAEPDYAVLEITEHVLNHSPAVPWRNATAEAVRPHLAIITHLCLSHADELAVDNIEGMTKIVARVCEGIEPGGICLLNHEMEAFDVVRDLVVEWGATPISYGITSDADVYITHMEERAEKDGMNVSVNIHGQEFSFHSKSYGTGYATNALGVLAAIHHLGQDAKDASQYIAHLPSVVSRLNTLEVPLANGTVKIVDDCFNAQLPSYMELIGTVKNWVSANDARKIGVFGDVKLFEDPKFSHEYRKLIEPISNAGFDAVYLVGKGIAKIADSLPAELVTGIFDTQEQALPKISAQLRSGDIAFMKVTSGGIASNNMALKLERALRLGTYQREELSIVDTSESFILPACVAYSLDSNKRIAHSGDLTTNIEEGLGHIFILQLALSMLLKAKVPVALTDPVPVTNAVIAENKCANSLNLTNSTPVPFKTFLDAWVVANAPDAITAIAGYIYPKHIEYRDSHYKNTLTHLGLEQKVAVNLTGRYNNAYEQSFTIDDLEKVATYFFSGLPLQALQPLKATSAIHGRKVLESDSVLSTVPGIIAHYCFGSSAKHAIALASVRGQNLVLSVCGAKSAYERDAAISTLLHKLGGSFEPSKDEWIKLDKTKGASRITIAGDTYFGEWYTRKRKARKADDPLEKHGYSHSLEKVAHFLPKEDFNIVGFEAVLTDKLETPLTGYYHWLLDALPKPTLKELKTRNVHAVMLGNNHALDFGENAAKNSKNLFFKNGFKTFGFGENVDEARKPLLIEGAGRKIIIFNAYWFQHTRHQVGQLYSFGSNAGVACIDNALLAQITNYRIKYPDAFIIMSPHWGPDFTYTTSRQKQLARQIITAGADCIIGHGSHMASECEYIDGKLVVYSLGNFVFNSGCEGMVGKVPFGYVSKLIVKKTSLLLRLHPIATYNPDTFYQPHPVTDEQFDKLLSIYNVPAQAKIVREKAERYLEFEL